MPSILFVYTSANKTLLGGHTGWYLPEAAHPYYVLSPRFNIDFASPAGPNPPIDQGSIKAFSTDENSVKFLNDETVKSKFANAKKLSDIDVNDYEAIFYVGGHGPLIDLAFDETNIRLASQFYQAGKVVASVCHGPAALVGVVDASGKSIFAGKTVTGFSNSEEDMGEVGKELPFLLEDKIVELGGKYEKATELWGDKIVIDGNLYTGQNPASSASLAQAILKALQ